MNETLAGNLDALNRIGASPLEAPTSYRLLTWDPGGDLRLRTSDGREVRLGSARNPLVEAAALVDAACGSGPAAAAVAVIGGGTGAVIEVLAARSVARILVIEPEPELAVAWLSRRSWSDLILAGRLRLLVGPAFAGAARVAQAVEGIERLPVVANPVLTREYPEVMLAARQALDRVVRDAAANADARFRFEDLAFRNTLANVPRLLREADAASLAGMFRGRPAIVVGAGPSLDATVATLRTLQDSCLVVAADTAVVPCLKGGLTPHLAVALDPSPENARHLTRIVLPDAVHLLCEAGIDPSVPRAFAGRTFFFRVGRHAPWPWLESAGITLAMLEAWGSVVTSALDVAVRAGCSPIIFAGLDLAFTRGQPYCRHTPLDDRWTWQAAAGHRIEDLWGLFRNARPVVMERAIEGGDTPTAAHLIAFRDWIRDYATARPEIRFVNGTGAGILHGAGIDVEPLDEFAAAIRGATAPDITETIRHIRAGAAPPAPESEVLSLLAGAAPLDLLEGHSAPQAAAERIGSADVAAVIDALRTGPATAPAGRPMAANSQAAPVSDVPLWLPDAARGLRALDPGHRETFGEISQRDPARVRQCLDVALDAVRNVLLQDPRATSEGTFHDPQADAWADVPAVVQVDWPPDVRLVVETATAALHEALRSGGWPIRLDDRRSAYFMAPADPRLEATLAGPSDGDAPLLPVHVGLDSLVWQWARVAAAALDTEAAIGRFVSCLRASCPPRLATPHTRAGLKVWLAYGAVEQPAGVPVVPFLHDRAVMRASTGLLTLDPASGPESPVASITPHAFHLFALPESWRPDEADLRCRRVPWSVMLEPDVLTDRGLHACRLATRLNETQALLNLFDGSGSYVVDEHGHLGRSEAWPRRVDGEICCGRSGRLAWHWDGASYLLFRRSPGASATLWDLPVAPMHALDDGEGAALLATTGGLWRCDAESGPQCVAPGPALAALHREGMDVRAYPPPALQADGNRLAIDRAFDWNETTQNWVERRLPPGEARLARSTQGPWTADTLMDASAIRITHESGVTFWLACSGPRSAAWAGRSLVVTLLPQGDVLLFRHLLDTVDAVVAASTVADALG